MPLHRDGLRLFWEGSERSRSAPAAGGRVAACPMECDRRLADMMGADAAQHILLPPMATPSAAVVLDNHAVDHFAAQAHASNIVHYGQRMATGSPTERANGGGAHRSSEQVEGAQQRRRMLSQATSGSLAHCLPVGSKLGNGVMPNGLNGVYHAAASSQRSGLSGVQTGSPAHQV